MFDGVSAFCEKQVIVLDEAQLDGFAPQSELFLHDGRGPRTRAAREKRST